jgi:hypothetical protein
MDSRRVVLSGVIAVIVVTAVVFGPLVSGISLADEDEVDFGADGSLTIASAQFPETATIEPAEYGAANAYLTVPATTVEFESLTGAPTLVYTLRIEALGLQRSTSHFLDDSYGPTFEATMASTTLEENTLDQSEYEATLSLNVRNGSGIRTAAEQNITVEVSE